MKAERLGRAREMESGLFGEPVALEVVAGMAARYQVIPIGAPAARARDHMVKRQFAGRKNGSTELACITVAQQNVLSRERPALMRDAAEFSQPDHRRNTHGQARRVNKVSVRFFGGGDAFENQHHRAADRRDVDRLVRSVEHEHRRLQHALAWFWHCLRLLKTAPEAYPALL